MLYYSIFSGWWKEMNTDSLKHLETVQNSIYECLHVQWQSGTSSLNEWLPGPFRSLWRSKEQKDQAVWRPPRPGPFDATASIVMRTFWAAPPPEENRNRVPRIDIGWIRMILRRLVTFRQPLDAIATSPWSRAGASVGRVAGPAPGKGQQFHHVFRSIFEKHGAEKYDELDGNLISG
jgi:hypothetical protein